MTGQLFNDSQPVELGTKFQANQAGTITQLKYYRAAADAGDTDVRQGHLWNTSGNLLATVTFTSAPGDDGWQVATLSAPVAIAPNTTYVVSYKTNNNYIAQNNFFDAAFTEPYGVLSSPASPFGAGGGENGNGVYVYGSAIVYPTSTYQNANYWVDVTFDPADGGPNTPPTFTSGPAFSAAENQTAAAALTANDPDGNALFFGISGGADAAAFNINATSGALAFKTAPNFEAPADIGATTSTI